MTPEKYHEARTLFNRIEQAKIMLAEINSIPQRPDGDDVFQRVHQLAHTGYRELIKVLEQQFEAV